MVCLVKSFLHRFEQYLKKSHILRYINDIIGYFSSYTKSVVGYWWNFDKKSAWKWSELHCRRYWLAEPYQSISTWAKCKTRKWLNPDRENHGPLNPVFTVWILESKLFSLNHSKGIISKEEYGLNDPPPFDDSINQLSNNLVFRTDLKVWLSF